METYYSLSRMLVLVVVIAQVVGITILIWALLKHRQLCFALLAFSAALGLAYCVLASIPFFVPPLSLQAHILLARVLLVLVVPTCIVGLWGWVLLVRSYRSSV